MFLQCPDKDVVHKRSLQYFDPDTQMYVSKELEDTSREVTEAEMVSQNNVQVQETKHAQMDQEQHKNMNKRGQLVEEHMEN